MIAGKPVDDAWLRSGGWSLPLGFGVAHHYDADLNASCGVKRWPFFYIGDWTACKRCAAKVGKPTVPQREAGRNLEAERFLVSQGG